MNLHELKYPLGPFIKPNVINGEILTSCISTLSSFPSKLQHKLEGWNEKQLECPYRPEGWTIRQVVNHCADSHMNAMFRLKLTLTEDTPVIKPYMEDRWAELHDSKNFSIEASLKILHGIHQRWTSLLNSLTQDQWELSFFHPEHGREFTLAENTCLYAWHCEHHLSHIELVQKQLSLK